MEKGRQDAAGLCDPETTESAMLTQYYDIEAQEKASSHIFGQDPAHRNRAACPECRPRTHTFAFAF